MSGAVPMAEPVCLIENDKEGNLRVLPQAIEILKRIDQHVVVVAIVGLYRTGKSYLMNKLAGRTKGFALGSTIQSKTKGIWMWCVPHPTRAGHTLVLLDTEGLGDVEKGDEKNDNWIFSLAVLLSSTLVYNSVGTIDNDALQRLHYVTELTEHIKVKAQTGDEDESTEFMRFFPSFVWTVRDFTLQLELDGKPITADQYLDNALKLKPGHGKQAMEYNLPRNCLRNYFPSRKCFVFDRPASAEKMRRMDELTDADLEPSFVSRAKEFCSYVFNNTSVKSMKGGFSVTGRMLGGLAEAYVDAIRSGQIPCLDNAVLALATIENSNAVAQAVACYKQRMAEWVVFPTETQDELSQIHGSTEKEAVKVFMDLSFKDEDQKYQIELMKQLQSEYEVICSKNAAESKKACASIIKRIFRSLEENLASGLYMSAGGHQEYRKELKNLISKYRSEPGKGIKDEEALKEFLDGKEPIGEAILAADHSLSEAERRMEVERARNEAMEQERRAAMEQTQIYQKQLMDQEQLYRDNMEQLMNKMEEDRRNAAKEYETVLSAKLEEQKSLYQEGFEKRAKLMQEEIDSLRREREDNDKRGSSSFLSNILETAGNAAAMFLPGIIPKIGGIAVSCLGRLFRK
ncbi:guanylate-binding protein 1-like [Megalops cyprinoides]|uniref:guanylate-binding protein 1-like n=1 Tax=Megalops cyprinoides TaxID=118141 RepID=UPI0018651E3A|nr:guanylate-binding protein 1-like [Megalops cyprinoides]